MQESSTHDSLPGDARQVIEGHRFPPADLGVGSGTVLVVLWALALGLVLGRDPDPKGDALGGWRPFKCVISVVAAKPAQSVCASFHKLALSLRWWRGWRW